MQCDISPTDKALRTRMIQVHIFLEEETQPFAEPNLEGAKLTNIAVHHRRPSQGLWEPSGNVPLAKKPKRIQNRMGCSSHNVVKEGPGWTGWNQFVQPKVWFLSYEFLWFNSYHKQRWHSHNPATHRPVGAPLHKLDSVGHTVGHTGQALSTESEGISQTLEVWWSRLNSLRSGLEPKSRASVLEVQYLLHWTLLESNSGRIEKKVSHRSAGWLPTITNPTNFKRGPNFKFAGADSKLRLQVNCLLSVQAIGRFLPITRSRRNSVTMRRVPQHCYFGAPPTFCEYQALHGTSEDWVMQEQRARLTCRSYNILHTKIF